MSQMTNEAELIRLLANAESTGTHTVDPVPYAALDRAAAYRIQTGVLTATGAAVGMLKTGIFADKAGVVAPIVAARVGHAPDFKMPSANLLGLEVEVGMVLKRDVASSADLPDAIDHYFTGVEICGSRFTDRALAGPVGGLADAMSALGYAIGAPRALGDKIDGLGITLDFAGTRIWDAPAVHGFATVLASLVAYADNQHEAYRLRAGTIITTGSMCGMVLVSGPGHVVATLGDDRVEFDIV